MDGRYCQYARRTPTIHPHTSPRLPPDCTVPSSSSGANPTTSTQLSRVVLQLSDGAGLTGRPFLSFSRHPRRDALPARDKLQRLPPPRPSFSPSRPRQPSATVCLLSTSLASRLYKVSASAPLRPQPSTWVPHRLEPKASLFLPSIPENKKRKKKKIITPGQQDAHQEPQTRPDPVGVER